MKVTTLNRLAERYDYFLVDQFGVLLDADGAYSFAAQTLARLAAMGKRIILLSNSGKRAAVNIDRITGHGIARDSFETMLTSGEVAFDYLQREIGHSLPNGARVWLVSRGGDTSAVDGLDVRLAASPDQADLVFLSGCDVENTTLDGFKTALRPAAQKGTPCLCSNPDLIQSIKGGFSFGTGRIAQIYAQMGGPVMWNGKPHPMIYDAAYTLLGRPDPARVLCIGDSPGHDILGGQQAGFATALVRTGIHAGLDEAALQAECNKAGAMPDYILSAFTFEEQEAETCPSHYR